MSICRKVFCGFPDIGGIIATKYTEHTKSMLLPAADSPKALAMRERLKQDVVPGLPPAKDGRHCLSGLLGLTDFVAQAEPEFAANVMVCAVNQAAYLLRRLVERQSRDFVEKGGFTERLYEARTQARAGSADAPECPLCGKSMKKRTAGKGANAGKEFWGCPAYPECRGTLDV